MHHLKYVSARYIFSVLLFAALTLFSCSEDDNEPADPKELEDVDYVAGIGVNAAGDPVATVWRAGVPTPLLASYPEALVYNSAAFGMDVVGKDVYVCGVLFTSKGNFPIYWKNGSAGILGPGNGQATAIFVVDDDIYVTGIIADGTGYSYGVLWKNGNIDYLTEGNIYSSASAVVVSGNDVYVGGNVHEEGETHAAYWKNGNPVLLTSGSLSAYVTSLALVGADVYTTVIDDGDETAKYWKNNQPVSLGDGTVNASVSCVHADGSDVYFAGTRRNGDSIDVIVWKNNAVVTTTPMPVFDIEISKLLARENVILLVGTVVNDNVNPVHSDATIWTNGEPNVLERGSDGVNTLFATSIDSGN
jgi:hypothetical protein